MKMKEFVEIIKRSHIAGTSQKKIIYQLFQALGANDAIGESAKMSINQVSNQSPSPSTIQSWLDGKTQKPRVSSYFPNHKIENEKGAYEFLRNTPKENQWKELRDLFREWYDNDQNANKDFYIDTETDDFNTFYKSFWRQFVSYFESLRLWDGAEELYPETKDNRENYKSSFVSEMIEVFKENFVLYKVYEFIPKEINDVISSLDIYYKILNENPQLSMQDNDGYGHNVIQELKKMYGIWVPDCDCFIFGAATCNKSFLELETSEGYIIIKCGECPAYDSMPTDTWMFGNYKYTVTQLSTFQDEQFDERAFLWKEGQGEIIIVGIDDLLDIEEAEPIIEDCYVLIDRMLERSFSIDEFITVTKEKIINKYRGVALDNDSRLLYNTIEQYGQSLEKFKKCLDKFRNLKKEKSEYLSGRAILKGFGMFSALDNYEIPPKPKYPFSECYLDPEEACKVELELRHYHKNLIELYNGIFNYKETYVQ